MRLTLPRLNPNSPNVPDGTAFRIPAFNLTAYSAAVPPDDPGRRRGPLASPTEISASSWAAPPSPTPKALARDCERRDYAR